MSDANGNPIVEIRRLPIRVLVCGGRHFDDEKLLCNTLDHLNQMHEITCVIEGGATGADTLASQWARSRKIENIRYPANWALYGKAAGPIRNAQMLKHGLPNLVVAFPGDKGTADMVRQAQKLNITIVEILNDGEIKQDGV